MRSITATYLVLSVTRSSTTRTRTDGSKYILRVYAPPECYSGPNNRIVLTAFKGGIRRFVKEIQVPLTLNERGATIPYSTVDFGLNPDEALIMDHASDPGISEDVEVWLTTLPSDTASLSVLGGSVSGKPGEVFKVDVIRGDQDLVGYPTTSDRVRAKLSVNSASDLPSRNGFIAPGVNDSEPKDRVSAPSVKNQLSMYESEVSAAYYRIDDATMRVVLMNLPPGFDRCKVEVQRSDDRVYGSDCIRKTTDLVPTPSSPYFFSLSNEPGNGFTRGGGYIVFDVQIRIDLRNVISQRVNDSEQNFFLNLRNVNGDLIRDNPRSALPLFKIATVHAGQYMNIRLRMEGEIGLERMVYVGQTISTMGYSKPRVNVSSSPKRLSSRPASAKVMSTIPQTPDNQGLFSVALSNRNVKNSDVFIDLNVEFTDVSIPESMGQILSIFRLGEPIIGGRQGGSFVVAKVKRYDSLSGNTTDLGIISTDRFIDRVSDKQDEKSIAAIIGASSREDFKNRASQYGLTIVYTAEFYEITPEMIAAFLSTDSPDDARTAELFSNVTNSREDSKRLLTFVNEIVSARTPLQQVALQVDYVSRQRPIPSVSVSRAVALQGNTNAPFNLVEATIANSEYVAYVEVVKALEDSAFTNTIIGTTRESIGFMPVTGNTISFRDFTPSDMTNVSKGNERMIIVRYELYPYEYVRENGLVGSTIRRRANPVVVNLTNA